MECYEGAKMIKTFRGLMADGVQDTIVLHTNDGSMGYRIVKFQIISNEPFAKSGEHVAKIYKVTQTAGGGPGVTATIDFSDNTLLGTAVIRHSASEIYAQAETVIFDREIFNQDIYVTHSDINTDNTSLNYYIELEQVTLDLGENTVATLKNVKNEATTIL